MNFDVPKGLSFEDFNPQILVRFQSNGKVDCISLITWIKTEIFHLLIFHLLTRTLSKIYP